ncbi:MAG TPA: proline--tRNA ligase [bacterium]|nr:proline--tRNA ligase [bacterium]
MRFSQLYLPTLKETPAEAELISHKLMLRAGLIRKLTSGVFSWLPLGVRTLRNIEKIVREEMTAAGAQEVLLPIMQPRELWEESGRWSIYGPTMMKLTDRAGREFGLGPTHEEVITDLVRHEIRSYRDLPKNLYQIGTKFRDEIRPRFGVMRGREFLMKDGYSFHPDAASLDSTYQAMYAAYGNICRRCGCTFAAVEADSGPIGGAQSHEFMILADSGEDLVIACEACGYGANVERAEGVAVPAPADAPAATGGTAVHTPGIHAVDEVAAFLKVRSRDLIKTMVYVGDGTPVVVLIRGDREINEVKLKNFLKVNELALADDATVAKVTGAPTGFAGPVGLTGARILADWTVRGMINAATGANRQDYHLTGVQPGDFTVDAWGDFLTVAKGDPCPRCGKFLTARRGIEMGHVFKLGTKYSDKLGATYLTEKGEGAPMLMGCYGIGVSRMVAAVIEQHHDEQGIIWPREVAPFSVIIVALGKPGDATMAAAETLYRELARTGMAVLLDDRNERPGVKFNDADLIGCPLRLTVGGKGLARGVFEMRERRSGTVTEIPVDNPAPAVALALMAQHP